MRKILQFGISCLSIILSIGYVLLNKYSWKLIATALGGFLLGIIVAFVIIEILKKFIYTKSEKKLKGIVLLIFEILCRFSVFLILFMIARYVFYASLPAVIDRELFGLAFLVNAWWASLSYMSLKCDSTI